MDKMSERRPAVRKRKQMEKEMEAVEKVEKGRHGCPEVWFSDMELDYVDGEPVAKKHKGEHSSSSLITGSDTRFLHVVC